MSEVGDDLFESAPCGYLEVGRDGRVIRANTKFLQLVDRSADDVVGSATFDSLLTAGGRIYHETHFRPLLDLHGQVHEIALDLRRPDGTKVPVLVSANVRDPGGEAVTRTIVFEAEHRRAYEQELLVAKRAAEEAEARAASLARTLLQTFVPPSPPDIPGLAVAGAYHPAGDGSEVGGDFYDVIQLRPGEWVVALGDVSGKGVEAAALTTFIRHAVRTLAVLAPEPSDVLRGLNQAMMAGRRDRFCTIVVLRLLREDDRWLVSLSSGGHPLPLLRRADGTVETVGVPGSLVGVLDSPSLHDVRLELDAGDTVVLYTDGVTEARRGDVQYGEDRLMELVAGSGRAADEVTAALLDDVMTFQDGVARDDIAVLALTAMLEPAEGSSAERHGRLSLEERERSIRALAEG